MRTAQRRSSALGTGDDWGGRESACGQPRPPYSAATKKIEHGQQNNGAQQRNQQGRAAETVLVDGRHAKEWAQEQAGNEGAHDANNDVHHCTLLSVCVHDHAGHPAEQAADDNPDNRQ